MEYIWGRRESGWVRKGRRGMDGLRSLGELIVVIEEGGENRLIGMTGECGKERGEELGGETEGGERMERI